MVKNQNKFSSQRSVVKLSTIPGDKVGTIGIGMVEIGKEVIKGYNMRGQHRVEMLRSAQKHTELLGSAEEISKYRSKHNEGLNEHENEQLTETFCQNILSNLNE